MRIPKSVVMMAVGVLVGCLMMAGMGSLSSNQSAVGAQTASAQFMSAESPAGGYWMVAADGGVFAFGGAGYYGSMGGAHLNSAIISITSTPDGKGY